MRKESTLRVSIPWWKRRIVLLLLALSGAAIAVRVRHLPPVPVLFPIEEIEVVLNPKLPVDDFRGLFETLRGTSLLRPVSGSFLKQVQSHAWVKGLELRKEFPNRVSAKVELYRPVAFAVQHNRLLLLDETGEIRGEANPRWHTEFHGPIVSFHKSSGMRLWGKKEIVEAIQTVQGGLAEVGSVSEVLFDTPPYLSIFLSGRRLEILASRETLQEQLDRLRILLLDPSGAFRKAKRISLLLSKKAVVSFPEFN